VPQEPALPERERRAAHRLQTDRPRPAVQVPEPEPWGLELPELQVLPGPARRKDHPRQAWEPEPEQVQPVPVLG
jgi:hypothetical protein